MKQILLALLAVASLAQTPRDLKRELAPVTFATQNRWALVIGISQFKNVAPKFQLQYAHRDAYEIASFLRTSEGGAIPPSHIRLLTDQAATASAIRAAVHEWLPVSAGPNDIVYVYFAGHAVLDTQSNGYFVAHDSDPQNLHATGVSFQEVNRTLSTRLRAGTVVLIMDACHAGSIGWTATPAPAVRTHSALEQIGGIDRSFLKILASRPSESSFEHAQWDGGHGIFTYALLRGLRGEADGQRDGVVRASELIEFIGRVVPQQTQSKQNPRVAGNFEASLPLSTLSAQTRLLSGVGTLTIRGPAGTAVYLDNNFKGTIRPTGELRVDAISSGPHRLSYEREGLFAFDQPITIAALATSVDLEKTEEFAHFQLQSLIQRGSVLGAGGAWEHYSSRKQPREAQATITAALEETAQRCVSDYVQSAPPGLKRRMLLDAVEAFSILETLRPDDSSLPVKRKFCTGRAQIASAQFALAVESLQSAIALDPEFACAYNALGVAYAQLGKKTEAREAFIRAGELTPEWGLPFLQLGQIAMTASDAATALPYLEKAFALNPRSLLGRWHLLRAYRLLRRVENFDTLAASTQQLDANYAPQYLEAGLRYETAGDFVKAAQAFDTYVTLAPNFGDSLQVRQKAQQARDAAQPKKPPQKPTLYRR